MVPLNLTHLLIIHEIFRIIAVKVHVQYLIIVLGAYDPMTLEGNIVVDGVLASCYASFDHDLVHLVTSPMRWYLMNLLDLLENLL